MKNMAWHVWGKTKFPTGEKGGKIDCGGMRLGFSQVSC